MITENLSTLKINKLTQAQYDRELAAGNIDPNALYLTPDEEIDFPVHSVNGKIGEVTLNASDIGARPNTWLPTVTEIGAAASSHTHSYLPLSGGTVTGNITLSNGKGYQQKDTSGNAYNLIFLSTSNTLQIGYGLPNSYPIKLNNMLVLTSDLYGTSLPAAGTAGRIFFKKVTG